MPVTGIIKDIDNRTLTITAQFAAPVELIWALYADPRQLEKIWGPPTYPATFVDHALRVGSRSTYYMTGPDGEKYAGWWKIAAVDEPNSFAFDDGFADENFNDNPDLPVSHNVYRFTGTDSGTTATYTATYETADALQQVLQMGAEEGSTGAINQIDAFLEAA